MSSPRPDPLSGVLVVDKPKGPTSARVVAVVKKKLDVRRVGHTGTLDPMATGVLPLCIGSATKLATFLLSENKAYVGEITLGVTTDSLDAEGQLTGGSPALAEAVTAQQLHAVLASFRGEVSQVPPIFSAVRTDGVRSHRRARAGESVALPPRTVRIDELSLNWYKPPKLEVVVRCSKGTYIRSIARDIGERLGCGGHLSALRRTQAGPFTLEQAVELEAIDRESAGARLVSPARAIAHIPVVAVGQLLVSRVLSGLQMRWDQLESREAPPTGRFSLIGPDGSLLAVAQLDEGRLRYERVFQTPS